MSLNEIWNASSNVHPVDGADRYKKVSWRLKQTIEVVVTSSSSCRLSNAGVSNQTKKIIDAIKKFYLQSNLDSLIQ